ncbi:hypothetical protein JTF06_06555 [Desemzia sp. RIT804]|uniref:hypothetical protein n=1 Tax=Desemzia sp. RIT 804 TaxID=2810209 RepID=UPI001950E8D2|nr:hypothetical protein [Desemzia sp. RIT 804]MBM6614549.1 hypothetical protein [Desemzia sp. RIT 804]
MKKFFFGEINSYIAVFNFFLAFFFLFQEGAVARLASYFFLLNFIVNLFASSRRINKQ